jgi:hypothetical protein
MAMRHAKPKPGARQPAMGLTGLLSALRKPVISLLILWQLLMVTFWLMPSSATQQRLSGAMHPYMWSTGCDQLWNMFSPPSNIDIYMQAKITYQDGAQKTWVFPRMRNLSLLAKYQKERFRKMVENAHLVTNYAVWPYVARFAAITNNTEPKSNPVVHVELIRTWQGIPPPGLNIPPYQSYSFYQSDYTPGSLDR